MPAHAANETFPDTTLSLVGRLCSTDAAQRNEALRLVATRYWMPLYDYARRTGLDEHAAADAVQDFFHHIFTHQDRFASYDHEKGRLRTWIITIYRHRAATEAQRGRALRRGGAAEHLPLDWALAESCYLQYADQDISAPERAYDRAFARQLWQQVLDSLRLTYTLRQKDFVFDTLHPLILGEVKSLPLIPDVQTQSTVLQDTNKLKTALHRLRKEAAHEFQRLVRLTVEGNEWQQEVRYLLGLVG